jgi:hypothetical protein
VQEGLEQLIPGRLQQAVVQYCKSVPGMAPAAGQSCAERCESPARAARCQSPVRRSQYFETFEQRHLTDDLANFILPQRLCSEMIAEPVYVFIHYICPLKIIHIFLLLLYPPSTILLYSYYLLFFSIALILFNSSLPFIFIFNPNIPLLL